MEVPHPAEDGLQPGQRYQGDETRELHPSETRGHSLCKAGAYIFCAVCGSFGTNSFRNLRDVCHGAPERKERLNRLLKGFDPTARGRVVIGTPRRAVRADLAHVRDYSPG